MKFRLILICLILLNCLAFAEGYYKPPILNDSNQSNNIQMQKEEPDFGPYMRELQRRIKLNWDPPKGKESLKTIALFRVYKNGELGEIRIVKSSKDKQADTAVINAIKRSNPFKPLPAEFKGTSIDIQFYFDYNVISR